MSNDETLSALARGSLHGGHGESESLVPPYTRGSVCLYLSLNPKPTPLKLNPKNINPRRFKAANPPPLLHFPAEAPFPALREDDSTMPAIPAQALIAACQAGDAAAVSRQLPAGGTPRNLSGQRFQSPSYSGCTPLMIAAKLGHLEIVRMILERAPNTTVDYAVASGCTALLHAARYHHREIVRVLADRGADVNYPGKGQGLTIVPLSAQLKRFVWDRGCSEGLCSSC